jgi:hypothetical protein
MAQEQRIYPPTPTGKVGEAELRYGHVVACTAKGCTTVETISAGAKSSVGGLPDDVVAKKLKQRGWRIRRGGRDRLCPGCSGVGRLPALADGSTAPGVVVANCEVPDCRAKLTLTRSRPWPIDPLTGAVTPPRSVILSQAKVEGWHVDGANMSCPAHRLGVKAAGVALASILRPDEARRAHARGCLPDCPDPEKCFTTYVDDAFALARETYGAETWDEAVRLAREEAAEAVQQAAQAARERDENMGEVLKLGDSPREPSRDDKRRINAKLTEVCADDGYAADWSDAKVAASLDVPVAWVAAIRSEFFSDHDSNEAQRQAAKEQARLLHELRRDMTTGKGKLEAAMAKLVEAEDYMNGLAARLAKLEPKGK